MSLANRAPKLGLTSSLIAALIIAGCGGGSGPDPVIGGPAPAEATATATSADDSAGPPAPPPSHADKPADAASEPADANAAGTPDNAVAQTALAEAASPKPDVVAQGVATVGSTNPATTSSSSVEIYVAVDGNDTWSGTLSTANSARTDGPVRTIAAAQVLARRALAAMAAGATRLPVNVRIGSGEYRLTTALVFGVADSGVPSAPVTYSAVVPGTVTISGSQLLGAPLATAVGTTVTVPSPGTDAGTIRGGTQLFVDGRRATLARSPNAGNYWFVQKSLPLPSEPTSQQGMEAFQPPAEALTLVNGLNTEDRARALVKVMHSWTSGRHRLSPLAAPAGGIRVTPRTPWAFLHFGVDQRFFIENVPSALDAPGEWIWQGSTVRYLPTSADVGKNIKIEMPVLERLLIVSGDEPAARWVQDLKFAGLTFANTRLLTPDAGFADRQAGSTIGAAVEVYAARRLQFDNCQFTRTGGYGLWFVNAVRDSVVSNSQFADLGAGGVKIGLVAQAASYANGTGANSVVGNRITNTGNLIPGAVGVWIGQSFDNTVANNLIANTTYTGISVGWSWQFTGATSGRNLISKNVLFNIGQGVLSDLGGIYTLGQSPGTVISGNLIHQVRPYPGYGSGAWGLYNDEASSDMVWEKNIVVGTGTGGYMLHRGRNVTVRSNILADGERGEIYVPLSDPSQTKLSMTNNLLLPKVTVPLQWFATSPDVTYLENKVSSMGLPAALDLAKCNGGCSIVAAQLTVGADPRAITVTGADTATATWVSEVTAQAGPPNWPMATVPVVNTAPPPVVVAPPIDFQLDISGTAIGAQPSNLTYRTGVNTNGIAVVANAGAPGGKCLNFADSPSNPRRFDPHAWATLNHISGTTSVEFSLLPDANTNFVHEWRDDATTFQIGPSFRVTARGLEINGRVAGPIALGSWSKFTVTAGLGANAGTWSLRVTNAAGAVTDYTGLPLRSAGWKRLNWLGFVSDSVLASNTCMAAVRASNPGT